MTTAHAGAALATHGIDFVNEDDGRCVLLGLVEEITDPRCTQTDEHLDEVRTCHGVEGNAGLTGYGPGQKGLTGSRRAIEQDTARYAGTQRLVLRGVLEEVLDLLDLLYSGLLTGHIGEFRLRGLPVIEPGRVLLAPHAEHVAPGCRGHPGKQEPEHTKDDQHGQNRGNQQAHHAGLGNNRVVALAQVGLFDGLDHLGTLVEHVVELNVLAEVLVGLLPLETLDVLGEIVVELELDHLHLLGYLSGFDRPAPLVTGQKLQTILGVDGLRAVLAAEEAEDAHHDQYGQYRPEPGRTPEGPVRVRPFPVSPVLVEVEEGVVALVWAISPISVAAVVPGRTLLWSLRVAHALSPWFCSCVRYSSDLSTAIESRLRYCSS